MQLENVIKKLVKFVNTRTQALSISVTSGSIDNMEKYKYMLGQAAAYQIIIQEISNLQKEDEKEQNDGNVIDIKGSTKN